MVSTTQQQTQPVPGRKPRSQPWLARLTLIVVSVFVLSNLVGAMLVAGYQIYYDGLIFPGVSVWGVDLSGMTPDEAVVALGGQFDYPQSAGITFRDGDDEWPVTAGDLGVGFDISQTVQAAYQVGRSPALISSLRAQLDAWRGGVMVSPVLVYDQRAADSVLKAIATHIDQPPMDATVRIQGAQAVTTESQIGRRVDVPATLEALGGVVTALEGGDVEVVVVETVPQVTNADEAAEIINRVLSADLEVVIEEPQPGDPGPWTASRDALANMLVIDRVQQEDGSGTYSVRLDEAKLAAFLEPLAPELEAIAQDAEFLFNDSTAELELVQPSRSGRTLDIPASIQAIAQITETGEHRVPLVFELIEPDIPDTATAEELGITEMIASATTYFAGSSQERRANVQQAASRFNGVVIPPGGEFSFNEHLGDVSVETGFEQALIIFNGRTIEGVGGGVCQVSTTAFQAAFFAGFPIEERWPHGYWVGYYDSGEGKGMDATVYSPLVDFRFTNDTPYSLLIETDTNLSALTVTFRFYSTNDGRTVEKDGPYVSNVVPHGPPLYEENASLPAGTTKQVDYAVDGFDTTVYRTVYRDGAVLYQDTFFSQYMPWEAIFQVPPGEVPPGAKRVGQ